MTGDMNMKKGGGLGRGLEALFEDSMIDEEVDIKNEEKSGEGVSYIKVLDLMPNSTQPRKKFDQEKLNALAESIKEHGVLQPIIARPHDGKYEIVAGERRWRAARIAGLESVPCIVRDLSDRENMLMAIIENMQREDLNPMEEANAFKEMTDAYGLTHDEISKTVGRSRPYISNSLRLLNLPEQVQEYVTEGKLSGGHARAIAGTDDSKLMQKVADKCINKNLSVREVEKLLSTSAEPRGRKKQYKPQLIRDVEKELTEIVGCKVNINYRGSRGKIEIKYTSNEELNNLIEGFRKFK